MNGNQESNQEKNRDRFEIFRREVTQKIKNESIDINKLDVIDKTIEWNTVECILFDILCNLILENLPLFIKGQEKDGIDKIIREKIVSDWENSSAATHLKEIQQSILDDERSQELLKLYIKILIIQERGGITINDNQDRRKLLEIGIIREEKDGRVKVANPIYENVFNREWAYQNLPTLPPAIINPKVNNKDRATKQSKRFSQSILIAFVVIAVAYPISRLSNESQQPSQSQSIPTVTPSPPIPTVTPSPQSPQQEAQNPQDRTACYTRKNKIYEPKPFSSLAKDAESAVYEYIKGNPSDLPKFAPNDFQFRQDQCKVVVDISLFQDQTFDESHQKILKKVIKEGINPDAINKIEFQFNPPIIKPSPKSN